MLNRYKTRRQRGAAMTEFFVALPGLLLLGLGSVQGALLYHAKTTLNYATFEAARKGSVQHAQEEPMREALGLRLAPLYGGDGSVSKAMTAIARSSLEVKNPLYTKLKVINPSKEAFDDFAIDNPQTGQREIPNVHLRYMPHDVGPTSGVNLQDANLLKIEVTHGFRLKVPLVASIVSAVMTRVDPDNSAFYLTHRIPLRSVATVRMQSEARLANNAAAGGAAGSGSVAPVASLQPPSELQGDPVSADPDAGNAGDPPASGSQGVANFLTGQPSICEAGANSPPQHSPVRQGLPGQVSGQNTFPSSPVPNDNNVFACSCSST